MLWTLLTSLQKVLKIDFKTAKKGKLSQHSNIWLIFFNSVLFVAMTTSHMILQMFLFLIVQNKSQTKSMMIWTYSTSLQKLLKIEIRLYDLNSVLFVAMAASLVNLQRFYF